MSGNLPSITLASRPPAATRYGVSASEGAALEQSRLSNYQPLATVGGGSFDVNGIEERLRQLEVRMTIAERSGRTIWEETMRTQTETRSVGGASSTPVVTTAAGVTYRRDDNWAAILSFNFGFGVNKLQQKLNQHYFEFDKTIVKIHYRRIASNYSLQFEVSNLQHPAFFEG